MKNFKNKTACIRSDMNRIKDVSTVANGIHKHKKSTKTIKSRGLQDMALDHFTSPHQPPADASHSPAGDQCVA